METQIPQSLGLNDSQATTYLYMLKHGKLSPAEIAKGTGEARTNTYNLLDQLVSLGLAEKLLDSRTLYRSKPPTVLKQLLVKRTQEVNRVNADVSSLLPSLLTTYRLTHNQPGVVQAEGHEAFKIIYDDVIRSQESPLIFASDNDRNDPETAAIIDGQIERQKQASIESKALVPKDDAPTNTAQKKRGDKK
ncbi:MAG: helix-turn-helix domain-containing protein [Candidatus Saccharibacteria bacterium]